MPKAFPLILLFKWPPDIASIGNILNVIRYNAVSDQDSNLSPSRQRANAKAAEESIPFTSLEEIRTRYLKTGIRYQQYLGKFNVHLSLAGVHVRILGIQNNL